MSARSDCYGTMFPDFTQLENNKPLNSPAFSALVVSHGIGAQGRTLEVKPDGWDKCVACPDYRTCYDLSLSKLVMNTLLANGWYGA
jgi:hypothetical protein